MPDPAEVAWQRMQTMSTKLVEALDALDDAGGLRRLAATWRPAIREKAKVTLSEARRAIEGAQAQLKDKPRK
ncbi:MAG: hypothetical protein JWN86_2539 [Planctomycetota bacterium]|nr:hypothetical protein [Planctomycetota bacterium]